MNSKMGQVRKFASFLSRHMDAPFAVKAKVWESAMMSSILYSCESWFTNNVSGVAQVYNNTLKWLLGVRQQTCSDILYVESGYLPVKDLLIERQKHFLEQFFKRENYTDYPLYKALELAKLCKSPMGRYFEQVMTWVPSEALEKCIMRIQASSSTRRQTYLGINPDLSKHRLYKDGVPEHHRIATTRLRLSSHLLKIETGRWSRIAVEDRKCMCGEVQTESHILLNCRYSDIIRQQFNNLDFSSTHALMGAEDCLSLCHYCYRALQEIYSHMHIDNI
jgi:hypothetical protein